MATKKPTFSVIIPTFNSARQLERCLDSLVNQSYKNFEVVVCDDGSTDNTKEIIEPFKSKLDLIYLKDENWGGPARPRNQGLKIAQADHIAFLDADDWWYPNKLEIALQFIDHADVIYHDLDIYTEQGRKHFKKVKGRYLKKPVFVDLMINQNALINSSVVVKKSLIEEVGGLAEDKKLISVEDFDLWLKLAKITEHFKYIPKSLGGYWLGQVNISGASEKLISRTQAVYEKHLPDLSQENQRLATSLMSYLLGRTKHKLGNLEAAFGYYKIALNSKRLKIKIRSAFLILFFSIMRLEK